MNLKEKIIEFPDFPTKGILFRDISPLLKDPAIISFIVDEFSKRFKSNELDLIAGIESRGFPFACALALKNKKGMIMVRKQGSCQAGRKKCHTI